MSELKASKRREIIRKMLGTISIDVILILLLINSYKDALMNDGIFRQLAIVIVGVLVIIFGVASIWWSIEDLNKKEL